MRTRSLQRGIFLLAPIAAAAALVGCGANRHADRATTTAASPTATTARSSPRHTATTAQHSPHQAAIVRRLPRHVVAKIDGETIRDSELRMLLAENRRAAQKRHAGMKPGSRAFRTAQASALHQLVVTAALQQAATRLGVVASPSEVQKRLRLVELDYAGIDPEEEHATDEEVARKFERRLKVLGMTKASLLNSLRTQILMEGLYRKVTMHVRPATAQAKAAAMQRWTRQFNERLARQVEYQRGFGPPSS